MITLATLAQATAQQVFDQVAKHLRGMSGPSLLGGEMGRCAYRGDNGAKCAAGCLIADNEYNPRMDDMGATSWRSLTQAGLVPNNHYDLISSLQSVHDSDLAAGHLEPGLKQTAKVYGLIYTEPEAS